MSLPDALANVEELGSFDIYAETVTGIKRLRTTGALFPIARSRRADTSMLCHQKPPKLSLPARSRCKPHSAHRKVPVLVAILPAT